jgi:glycosyltransferase involved in cell wall biosynthesis
MESYYKFSFIIPYRHNIDRFFCLKKTLDWVNRFNEIEVILVEQDTHSKISHLNLKAKHIFIKSNEPFNKSHAYNVALKHTSTEIIIFSDSDLIMDSSKIIEGVRSLSEYEMVSPYSRVIDLTPQESQKNVPSILNINREARGETDIQKVPLCGGTCIFRKTSIMKIGGWSEEFVGWGAEDDFQSEKVKHFLKWKEMEGNVYHLYHHRPSPDPKLYQRNLSILEKAKKMSKEEMQKYINSVAPKIGMINKYDNF